MLTLCPDDSMNYCFSNNESATRNKQWSESPFRLRDIKAFYTPTAYSVRRHAFERATFTSVASFSISRQHEVLGRCLPHCCGYCYRGRCPVCRTCTTTSPACNTRLGATNNSIANHQPAQLWLQRRMQKPSPQSGSLQARGKTLQIFSNSRTVSWNFSKTK